MAAEEKNVTSSHTKRKPVPVPFLHVPVDTIGGRVFYGGRTYEIRSVGFAKSNGVMFIYYGILGTEMLLVLEDIPLSGGGYHAKFWDSVEFDAMIPLTAQEVEKLMRSQQAQQLIRRFAAKSK